MMHTRRLRHFGRRVGVVCNKRAQVIYRRQSSHAVTSSTWRRRRGLLAGGNIMGAGEIFIKIVWVENSFQKIPIGRSEWKKINNKRPTTTVTKTLCTIVLDAPSCTRTIAGGVPFGPLLCVYTAQSRASRAKNSVFTCSLFSVRLNAANLRPLRRCCSCGPTIGTRPFVRALTIW